MMLIRRKFSLQKKTLLIIILMAVLLSGVSLFISQSTFSHNNENRFKTQATELAKTVRAVVDVDQVEALRKELSSVYNQTDNRVASDKMGTPDYDSYVANFKGIKNSESFRLLYTVLRGIQDANQVESIYLIYVDVPTRATIYMVDVSNNPCPPGHFDELYDENEEVLTNAERGFPAYITNTAEYGWLVSAGVPVHNESGEVIAYAFADISMNAVKKVEINFLITLSALLFTLTVILCVIYILIVNHAIVKPINQLSDAVIRYYDSDAAVKNSFDSLEIHTGDEIENLSLAMKQMEENMNTYIHDLTEVTKEKERIGAELNVATQIQADMLPRIFPAFPERHEFDLYATMHPAKEVGGDFYDFFLADDDHIVLVMADVSGKGVPAALFMVIAKTLIKNRAILGESPAEVLKNVNEQLCEGNETELFVTVWLAVIEISTGRGIAANAGHEHPVICRAGGQYELVKYRHSPAVATMEGISFFEHCFELNPGDKLFVYTDGVTEATDANDNLFGTDRMLESLNSNTNASPRESLSTLQKDINTFVGTALQFDDITMLGFHYSGNM